MAMHLGPLFESVWLFHLCKHDSLRRKDFFKKKKNLPFVEKPIMEERFVVLELGGVEK